MPGDPGTDGRLAIVAGSGRLPHDVAVAARANGENPFIVVLRNEADRDWSDFDHVTIGTGDFAALQAAFRREQIGRVVLSGGVRRRPELREIRSTFSHLLQVPRVVRILTRGGDDAVLRMVITLIEGGGYRVVAAQQVVPGLLAETGPLTQKRPGASEERDIAAAREAASLLGRLDIGQGAVAVGGRVVALEGVEGTDAMLERVASLRAAGRLSQRSRGVLVKLCKPQQDERADLPSIGLSTIAEVAAAGLAGIAVEAGRSLVLDREALIAEADAKGLFVLGLSMDVRGNDT
ncbi:LpxI family protein [Pararhizobium mangrovi]|uniref:LpxI family protein n=1 Tax=Pararhizobium mangrovi TaxID=2590452 RepID=A0A506UA11_9HYPH|nr:LpxI family protein [Pararhizobium mangrovi]TPW31223.1 LpxI family protein [Pararhizobium mangrovi]